MFGSQYEMCTSEVLGPVSHTEDVSTETIASWTSSAPYGPGSSTRLYVPDVSHCRECLSHMEGYWVSSDTGDRSSSWENMHPESVPARSRITSESAAERLPMVLAASSCFKTCVLMEGFVFDCLWAWWAVTRSAGPYSA